MYSEVPGVSLRHTCCRCSRGTVFAGTDHDNVLSNCSSILGRSARSELSSVLPQRTLKLPSVTIWLDGRVTVKLRTHISRPPACRTRRIMSIPKFVLGSLVAGRWPSTRAHRIPATKRVTRDCRVIGPAEPCRTQPSSFSQERVRRIDIPNCRSVRPSDHASHGPRGRQVSGLFRSIRSSSCCPSADESP